MPRGGYSSGKSNKPCLREVVVEAQCLAQTAALHELVIDGMNAGGRATKLLCPPANEYLPTPF